jgi:FkbM family methyltransferase
MNELIEFSLDTENGEKNYNLAQWYESIGHTAPAHTYYLRASERTEDDVLAYQALIRASFCYKSQGSRDATEKVLLENALMLLPERPEAYYFLSSLYERKHEHQNCYIYANFGLDKYKNEIKSINIPEYRGKYLLIFQKALSSWWWGKGQECRDLFQLLVNDYWNEMDENCQKVVEDNLSRLGITKYSQSQIYYNKENSSSLRYKFKNFKKIDRNYSQIFQDIFVLSMLDGKENGTFLEIGGAKPFERNNTALLEQQFNWSGVSIELDENFVSEYRKERPNTTILHRNALEINYEELLSKNFQGNIIDYLQLDIEPAKNTYECMLKIPFDDYKFAVITYEHDHYIDVTKSYREKSRQFLKSKGYVLVVNDLSPEGKSTFEDWWVHPDLVSENILNIMSDVSSEIKNVETYMLSNHSKQYYAEFETDKYIRENFFPDFDYRGIMVEVGAGPPSFISSSKHFRDNGWRTICVEPNPKFITQHQDVGSEVYPYACANEEKKTSFVINYNNDEWYSQENDGVSFSSLDIRYVDVPQHNTQETIEVETIRLNTLLERIHIDKIDILSIDVEGWELDVMLGFDHIKYDPKVIVLENFEYKPEYEKFMKERGYIKDTELGYNQIYVKIEKNNFNINTSYKSTSWIVDNFYENPDEVRKFALEQDYLEGGIGRGFIGRRTHQQFLFPGLKERFEEIMGRKITAWEEHGMNGRFQISWSGEPLVYHCDSQRWGGMLYLSPGAPYQCGTTLYAHKQTRARTYYDQGWDAAWKDIPGDPHLDGTPFEPVDVLGNVYNRLVIFDASAIHSASEYFGTIKENARLWQMFFFDT